MLRTLKALVCCLLVGLIAASASAQSVPRWLTLPPTPTLPTPQTSGHAAVNGISIWYATFGSGPPVILLYGAMAPPNSVAKPTRTGSTKVTRSMLATQRQSAICRRDQGAQSGAVDGG